LFMARAVRLRIDAAYYGILLLLGTGSIASLLKGFDWQEALVMMVLLTLFLSSRRFFYRKSSLFSMPFSWSWVVFVGIILIGSTWIGFFPINILSIAMIYGGNLPIKVMRRDFSGLYR